MNQTPEHEAKPEHEIRRPGWKSSEAIFGAATAFIVVAGPMLSEAIKESFKDSPYTPFALAILAGLYAVGRSHVKGTRNTASAAVAAPSAVATTGDVNLRGATEHATTDEPQMIADGPAPTFFDRPIDDDGYYERLPENQNIEVIDDADHTPQGS